MFTGIIEGLAEVVALDKEAGNLNISLKSNILSELKIDQSISHNGVCLTVVDIKETSYCVTAIKETLEKTNLSELEVGMKVNIERALKLGDRLDGHMVQGHVDQIVKCLEIKEEEGSYVFTFEYAFEDKALTVEKGSVCLNGVSLTVVNSKKTSFSVAIIPYTFEHTNFKDILIGDMVNIEFDILGKYIKEILCKS